MRIKYLLNKDKRVNELNTLIKDKFPQLLTEKKPELFLVAGGDGAMLHAIHETIDTEIPYLGKALGTLNFLMNDIKDDEEVLKSLINDEIEIETFKSNAIVAYLNDTKLGEAVNEVILGESIMGYNTFEITTENGDFNQFEVKGSGLCISTTIGSTAFNFNNGGRILPLDSDLLSITGVVCNRYLNDIIKFQEIRIKANGAKIYLSNVDSEILDINQELILKKGKIIDIAFLDKESFLKRRREIAHRYRK